MRLNPIGTNRGGLNVEKRPILEEDLKSITQTSKINCEAHRHTRVHSSSTSSLESLPRLLLCYDDIFTTFSSS